ncbi:MAG TPA: membrane dipeptidase [Vicinamibacterales bacterium]|nr:membrane dipeptidase [Vicinamibacterales bacterium]
MITTRRGFLQQLGAAAATARAADSPAQSRPITPFPYVDGLTLAGPMNDLAASGLSAFLVDVSRAERLETTDGSIKYWRSFDATSKSIAEMRTDLAREPLAFHATRGSEIAGAHRNGRTAVFFQVQGGGEIVGQNLDRLDALHALGLRVFQITHHNDNPWGGGAIEPKWSGLTALGRAGVERLHALGMIPDLAHVSDPTCRDVIAISRAIRKAVIVSHGGARALVDNARCTPDDVIRGVADSGGAMGVFMMTCWLTTDPMPTPASYVAQIRHIVRVGGIDAVGIANDYAIGGDAGAQSVGNDNARAVQNILPWWNSVAKSQVLGFDTPPAHVVIPELNNPRRAFLIHDALDRAGFRSAEIEKIMGGNWIRVLRQSLG